MVKTKLIKIISTAFMGLAFIVNAECTTSFPREEINPAGIYRCSPVKGVGKIYEFDSRNPNTWKFPDRLMFQEMHTGEGIALEVNGNMYKKGDTTYNCEHIESGNTESG